MSSDSPGSSVGRSIDRTDGRRFVTGAASYVDDLDAANQLHLALVRSRYGHAEITDVDASDALAMDGVHYVLTGEEVAAETNAKGIHGEDYALATDRVRYYGEPVAAVAAESSAIAEDAAELVSVEYERLDAVLDAKETLEEDAPLVHPELDAAGEIDGNVSATFRQRVGDADAAFESAASVVRNEFRCPAFNGAPMETHGCIAEYDPSDDSVELHTSTQNMHAVKRIVGAVFGLPDNRVHVVQPEVGGGFGNKLYVLPHEICAILLSKRLDRPVKSKLSRQEQLEMSKASFEFVMDVSVAVEDDGTITGWREEIVMNEGAYHEAGLGILGGAGANSQLVGYKIPNVAVDGKAVYTNRTPSGAVRGVGARQLAFARECIVDQVADQLDVDPVELRRQQTVSNDECPYELPMGQVMSTTGLDAALDAVLEAADYEALRERVEGEEYVGIGVATGHHVSSCRNQGRDADYATVDLRLEEDGSATLRTEACDMGTGCRTTLSQIAADALGIEPTEVRVVDGDTQKTPPGQGSHGSRTLTMAGTAAHRAATELRENLAEIASAQLEAHTDDLEFADGSVRVAGTDREVAIAELAGVAFGRSSELPDGMFQDALSVERTFESADDTLDSPTEEPDEQALGNSSISYPSSCQLVVAAVDPRTGKVTIEEHYVADDVGNAVNPQIVEGQMHGGTTQGIGVALSEALEYDQGNGQVYNSNFSDYGIPTAPDVPHIETRIVEVPSPNTPGGWKGVAEGPMIVGPPAVANAVSDAIGVRMTDLPLTPEKVSEAIADAE